MDDPLFLVMQGIWLLAAGMYPLGMGFLFGLCSACCECPEECSKCSRAYSGTSDTGPCSDVTGEWTMQLTDGNLTNGTVDNKDLDLTFPSNYSTVELPFSCRNAADTANYSLKMEARMQTGRLDVNVTADECGCLGCCRLQLQAEFILVGTPDVYGPEVNDFQLDPQELNFEIVLCDCSEETVTVSVPIANSIDFSGLIAEQLTSACADEYSEWESEQELVFTLTNITACECGSCCTAGQCEEPVTELYCEDHGIWFNKANAGVWQGVGTDCDPNPCPQLGACCDGGECSETLEADCGGVFQGEGTSCDPNPC